MDLKARIPEIPANLGRDTFARVMPFLSVAVRSDQTSVPGTHLDLQFLGTKPTRQGHGVTSTLIRAIVTRADAESLPRYLETFEARNVSLHPSHGFTIEAGDPDSPIRGWGFLRA